MVYSYEEARAREAELLRSAQRVKVASVPRAEERPRFSLSRLVKLVRVHDGAHKPAVTRA
jgi:hypothetical protein